MIPKKGAYLKEIQDLALPISSLKGVGPKRAALFAQKGLYTILDLFFFTPLRYEDRTRLSPIHSAEEGIPVLIKGKVLFGGEERFFRSRKRLFKICVRDETAGLELLWFQYMKPHLTKFTTQGLELLAYGTIGLNRGQRQMVHPEIIPAEPGGTGRAGRGLGFYPVYSSVAGLSSSLLRSTVRRALDDYLGALIDPLPTETTRALGLPSLKEAVRYVHFPPDDATIETLNQFDTPSHQRLMFDRFFLVMLIMAFRKKSRQRASVAAFSIPPTLMADPNRFFPFDLTADQISALEDMVNDLVSGKPMNRLLLGDVGCGKTAVAALAAHITIRNERQVAIMAPTQVLANQHLEYFLELSDRMGFRPVLMTGAMKKEERDRVYKKVGDGSYNMVIGTQSLIQEKLLFSNLGLVIIDEQHRFGVRERALMDRKGRNPHQLVMTATPIPRTLAMTVYGDMDVSVIKEHPRGRLPVDTHLVPREKKRMVFEVLKDRLARGQQAFVICPLIEGSEDLDLKDATEMAERLKAVLSPAYRVGLVHGRLPADKREAVMAHFRKGIVHLLVATTVIEVGLHVPKATLMIIEHPDRFGLAQLHQLRGRIGRGTERGICYLMLTDTLSERTSSRLRILVENQDGFEIAQKDLEQRGQGELIGVRQAGVGDLDITELMREPELLSKAKEEAERIIDRDPDLKRPENHLLRAFVDSVLSRPIDL